MNVLFVTHEDDKYGAARSLSSLVEKANHYDVNPIILTMKHNRYSEIAEKNNYHSYVVRYYRATTYKNTPFLQRTIKSLRYSICNKIALKKILKIIEREKVDIVHTNTSIIDIGLDIKKHRHTIIVQHVREFLDLDFNQKYYRSNQIERMNKFTDRFIYISKAIQNHWETIGINKDYEVIYNGLDVSAYCGIQRKCIFNNSTVKIAFVGSITPNKGQYQLVEALNLLDNMLLDNISISFFGTGDKAYIEQLQNRIDELGLQKKIAFEGYCENIYELLSDYDIGIVASKAEGFGRVTVEYMLSAMCVIVSDTGANCELIEHGKTGYVFKHNDYYSLSDAISTAILNKDVSIRISKEAYSFAKEHFSDEVYVKNIINLYKKVLNEQDINNKV